MESEGPAWKKFCSLPSTRLGSTGKNEGMASVGKGVAGIMSTHKLE